MKVEALLILLAGAGLGCGRTVTEDDCVKIRDNMREAWTAESKKAAPADSAGVEKAQGVIKAEGEKLTTDWMAECKKELQGRRVEPREIDCLLAAKSIAQINKCSER
jgi:hypothetical protein